MDNSITLTSGALSAAVLQVVKMVWRKWVIKNPNYDFPFAFYAIMLPVLNALAPFALVAIGFPSADPVLGMNWQGVLLYVVRVGIGAVVSMMAYDTTNNMNEYRKTRG
jgi:hypothetical protein